VRHPHDLPSIVVVIIALIVGCSDEPKAPICGDGVQDPSEACDDGNRDSGDTCTAACQIPGTSLECVTLLEGTGGGYDEVNALLPLPDLSFGAAGAKQMDGRRVPWIGRFEDSGQQSWLTWPPPNDDGSSSILDLAADSSEGYWALLVRGGDEELLHLDTSGQIDTRLSLSEVVQPVGFGVGALRLLVVGRHVWLAGSHGHDLWVGRFDVETQVLATVLTEDHAGFDDEVRVIAGSDSEIAVAATVDMSPSSDGDLFLAPDSDVLLIRFDLEGQEVGRQLLGAAEPELATRAYSIAADATGGWVVGGIQGKPSGGWYSTQAAWVTGIHPDEGWAWTWTSAAAEPGPTNVATVEDIVVTDHDVVAVGSFHDAGNSRAWLVGLGLDGALHWEQSLEDQGYENSEATAVVLDQTNRLRIASNAWNNDDTSLLQACIVAW
jgi:cysteine-rich repeat protein